MKPLDENSRRVHIYALLDPFTFQVRYIGRAVDPDRRLTQHLIDAHLHGEKAKWIARCRRNGRNPLVTILDMVDEAVAETVERAWIQYASLCGVPLTNTHHSGGRFVLGPIRKSIHQIRRKTERDVVCLDIPGIINYFRYLESHQTPKPLDPCIWLRKKPPSPK